MGLPGVVAAGFMIYLFRLRGFAPRPTVSPWGKSAPCEGPGIEKVPDHRVGGVVEKFAALSAV